LHTIPAPPAPRPLRRVLQPVSQSKPIRQAECRILYTFLLPPLTNRCASLLLIPPTHRCLYIAHPDLKFPLLSVCPQPTFECIFLTFFFPMAQHTVTTLFSTLSVLPSLRAALPQAIRRHHHGLSPVLKLQILSFFFFVTPGQPPPSPPRPSPIL